MGDIDVNGAIGAGFSLIRRRPLAVLAWGLAQSIGLAVILAGYVFFFLNMSEFALPAKAAGTPPVPDQTMRMMGRVFASEGFIILGGLVMLLIRTAVWTAIWRAVIHPERGAWAYLRIGAAELFIVGLLFGLGFAANFLMLPLMPLMFVVFGLVAYHQYLVAAVVAVVVVFAVLAIVIYLELRFSVLGPMIVDDGQFHFAEAWTLTRGKAGRLFLVGLGLVAIVVTLEVLLALVIGGVGLLGLDAAAGGLAHVETFFQQPPAVIAGKLWPLLAVWIVGAIPVGGALSAIGLAPWARAYVDLKHDPSEVTA